MVNLQVDRITRFFAVKRVGHGRVHAYRLAGDVEQGAAGIARIDGRVGLNQALKVFGAAVAAALNKALVAPSTMTIYFSYYASASSNTANHPYFKVAAGNNTNTFTFPSNSCSGSTTLSVAVPSGATWSNVQFTLFSGDWGSTVDITSITFQ